MYTHIYINIYFFAKNEKFEQRKTFWAGFCSTLCAVPEKLLNYFVYQLFFSLGGVLINTHFFTT